MIILDGVEVDIFRRADFESVFRLVPSSLTAITAAGGITPTSPHMRVQGSGGAITITANPQIVAGIDGQLLLLEGGSDTNTVTINDGTGLHLHGGPYTFGNHDYIMFSYEGGPSEWQEIFRNAIVSEKSWAFETPVGASGIFWAGGFYDFAAANNDFDPSINFGTVNAAKAAHLAIVLGELSVDEIQITVSGASITDTGTRNGSDTEVITIPDATAADTYYETAKKWLGQVAIETTSGTAKNCNYGFVKYWDNNNNDFRVLGLETTWLSGGNDNAPDIQLLHHKTTGWTYNGGAIPTHPPALASMATDYGADKKTVSGEEGAWKRDNLNTTVDGSGSEGALIEITTTANRAFVLGTFLLRMRPD